VPLQYGTLVLELSPADTGVNDSSRCIVQTDEGDVEAFVKRLSDPRKLVVEIACSVLGRRLGLPIPEPLVVFVPSGLGGPGLAFGGTAIAHPNLMVWVKQSDQRAVLDRLRSWQQLMPAACFDEWIANCDRHAGNLIFDGISTFWLIDHDLAISRMISADQIAPLNQLFGVAIEGLVESQLLTLRPKATGVMSSFRDHEVDPVRGLFDEAFWPMDVIDEVFNWLAGRQDHLVRLGNERIPARQGGLF